MTSPTTTDHAERIASAYEAVTTRIAELAAAVAETSETPLANQIAIADQLKKQFDDPTCPVADPTLHAWRLVSHVVNVRSSLAQLLQRAGQADPTPAKEPSRAFDPPPIATLRKQNPMSMIAPDPWQPATPTDAA